MSLSPALSFSVSFCLFIRPSLCLSVCLSLIFSLLFGLFLSSSFYDYHSLSLDLSVCFFVSDSVSGSDIRGVFSPHHSFGLQPLTNFVSFRRCNSSIPRLVSRTRSLSAIKISPSTCSDLKRSTYCCIFSASRHWATSSTLSEFNSSGNVKLLLEEFSQALSWPMFVGGASLPRLAHALPKILTGLGETAQRSPG